MTKLTDTISSGYFAASEKIRGLKYRLVKVFVEGYDDISFWRSVLDEFQTDKVRFEVSVPVRGDLAKGKKVVMAMAAEAGPNLILCVDSDFDYVFGDYNDQSRSVNRSPYIFHTYVYAIENFVCYAPSLHALCVKATKNDSEIFDFEAFMGEYSRIIYPVFLWYAFSARKSAHKVFPLIDFKNTVRLNYLDMRDNGLQTLEWLRRQVEKRLSSLHRHNARYVDAVLRFEKDVKERGITQEESYLFMQGHTLKENVVIVMLSEVCDKLREMSTGIISGSSREGLALKNEMSNYNNSLRNIKEVLDDNEGFRNCPYYGKLRKDIREFMDRTKVQPTVVPQVPAG